MIAGTAKKVVGAGGDPSPVTGQICQDCGEPSSFDWDGFILPCDGCGFDQLEDDRPTIIQNRARSALLNINRSSA